MHRNSSRNRRPAKQYNTMLDIEFNRSQQMKNNWDRRRKCGQSSAKATEPPQCFTLNTTSTNHELTMAKRHSTVIMITTRRVSSARCRDARNSSLTAFRMEIIDWSEMMLLKMVINDGRILPRTKWDRWSMKMQRFENDCT